MIFVVINIFYFIRRILNQFENALLLQYFKMCLYMKNLLLTIDTSYILNI